MSRSFRYTRRSLSVAERRRALNERKVLCALILSTSLSFADTTSAPASGDLLSQYDQPARRTGFFSKLLNSFGLEGSAAKQGSRAYRKKDYDRALQKYAEAALDQPSSQALAYNTGNAEFRKQRYDAAIAAFTKALQGQDAPLAAKSHYNLGNAHFRKGESALQAGREEGLSDYREALAHYKKALEISPDNRDAKLNIEVVQARLKELLDKKDQQQQQQPGSPQKPPEPSARAKEALARALQLAQQRRYGEAKSVLEEILREDATAASFKSHLQRLDDVTKIQKGEKPSSPAPRDPRAQQGGLGVI